MTPQFKADNLVINETRDSIYRLQFEDNDKTYAGYYQGRPLHPKLMTVSYKAPEKFA